MDKFLDITIEYPKFSDGELYMMAVGAYTEYFLYHPSLFEKAGAKVPETWDEFYTACEQFQAADITPVASCGETWYVLRWASFKELFDNFGAVGVDRWR